MNMISAYYPQNKPNTTCQNSRRGGEFSDKARNSLLEETKRYYGSQKCMVPDCTVWYPLEFHHIRPVWAGGSKKPENGIALCSIHHFWADRGAITYSELRKYKEGKGGEIARQITGIYEIRRFLEEYSGSYCEGNSVQEMFGEINRRLNILYRCASIPLHDDRLRRDILTFLAKTQLELAGALTSWIPSNRIPKNKSNRYQINILANSAVNIANIVSDNYILLHAYHTHAVNSNATGAFDNSVAYCERIYKLIEQLEHIETGYASYITRNISTIYAKTGRQERANILIELSKQISENESETWMRDAQNSLVTGNLKNAELRIEKYLSLSEVTSRLSNIQQVISSIIRAVHECLTGEKHIPTGITILENAQKIAQTNELGHHLSKIKHAISYFSSKGYKKFITNYGINKIRRGSCPREILRIL